MHLAKSISNYGCEVHLCVFIWYIVKDVLTEQWTHISLSKFILLVLSHIRMRVNFV